MSEKVSEPCTKKRGKSLILQKYHRKRGKPKQHQRSRQTKGKVATEKSKDKRENTCETSGRNNRRSTPGERRVTDL
jgi:hypothetical protein